jgi:hypothetical protein
MEAFLSMKVTPSMPNAVHLELPVEVLVSMPIAPYVPPA